MNSEVQQTIGRYFTKEVKLHYLGSSCFANEIIEYLSRGKYFFGDAPDLVIQLGEKFLVVEHFEFDCYKRTRAGSKNRAELARVDRVMKGIQPDEHGVLIHDEIIGESSYEFYLENIFYTFTEHYRKIPDYLKNIRKKGIITDNSSVRVAFIIEDASPLGVMAYDEMGIHPIVLSKSKEFLLYMSRMTNLDSVIACSGYDNSDFVWLISKEELDEYLLYSLDYANMTFIKFKPQIASFKAVLSDKNDML